MTDASLPLPNRTTMTPRKRMTANDARLRTLRVKATRLLFMGGAIASVSSLVGSVLLRAVQTASLPTPDLVQGENLVLDTPRFVGRSKSGGKIVVTAQKATRSMSQENGAVQLTKPVLETSDGSKATADSGIWSQSAQTLVLSGNVVLNRQGGDVARAASANWTSVPERLDMTGGVELIRQSGDRATGTNAVWDAESEKLSLSGAVNLTRPSGDNALAENAVWDTAAGRLLMSGAVSLTRPTGDRATSDTAVWDSATGRLSVLGNVGLMRQNGAQASGGSAVWQSGTLDMRQSVGVTLPSGESASAQFVRFNEGSGDLLLQGSAVIRFGSGQASSARAFYQGSTGTIVGDGNTQITSGLGFGSADRYVYETRSKRLRLTGTVRATLQR